MEKIEIDCASSSGIQEYIKVPVLKALKESRFNTQKLLQIYGQPIDELTYILDNNSNMNDPEYNDIINTWKSAEEFRAVDEDIYEALIATCYYKMYKNLHEKDDTDLLMDQPEEGDTKTKPKLNYNKLAEYLIKKYTIISHNGIPYLFIGNQYYIDC